MVQSNRFRILAVAGCIITGSLLFIYLATTASSTYTSLLSKTTDSATESLDLVGVRGISDLIQGLGLGDHDTQSARDAHGLSRWRSNLGLQDTSLADFDTQGQTAAGDDKWSKAAAAVNQFMDLNSVSLTPAQPKLPEIESPNPLLTQSTNQGLKPKMSTFTLSSSLQHYFAFHC